MKLKIDLSYLYLFIANSTPQSSPIKPLMEVMVQGPQISLVTKYLIDTKGFPEKYLETITLKKKEKM